METQAYLELGTGLVGVILREHLKVRVNVGVQRMDTDRQFADVVTQHEKVLSHQEVVLSRQKNKA